MSMIKQRYLTKERQEVEFFQELSQLTARLSKVIVENNLSLSQDQFREIFRIVHTIKGSSMAMDLDELTNLSHALEDQLATAQDWRLKNKSSIFQFINQLKKYLNCAHSKPITEKCLSSILPRVDNAVKSLARDLNKEIKLNIQFEPLTISSHLLQLIYESLIQLVRNSCDHAAENKCTRIKSKKPSVNQLKLTITHSRDCLFIVFSDDGLGMDKKIVDLFNDNSNLIFLSQAKISKKVSRVSGRGLGLDIITRNIKSIDGDVKVVSNKGEGSEFSLIVPINARQKIEFKPYSTPLKKLILE